MREQWAYKGHQAYVNEKGVRKDKIAWIRRKESKPDGWWLDSFLLTFKERWNSIHPPRDCVGFPCYLYSIRSDILPQFWIKQPDSAIQTVAPQPMVQARRHTALYGTLLTFGCILAFSFEAYIMTCCVKAAQWTDVACGPFPDQTENTTVNRNSP